VIGLLIFANTLWSQYVRLTDACFDAIHSAEIQEKALALVISDMRQRLFNIRSQVVKILNAAGITHEGLGNA
jgi:hypothetical protein